MFYGQCNDCGERWELGTSPTCKCPDEALASEAKKPDFWEGYVPEPVKPATEESSATQAQQALDKKAENARELGLDYEPAQPYKSLADYPRYWIDPVTGDVSIGTPSTPAPATELREQEPVARQYQNRDGVWKDFISEKHYKDTLEDGSWPIRNLYTSPPALSLAQRSEASTWVNATEWRGLTNNELQPIADEYRILFGSWVEDFARAIEAKLKEKNT